MADYLMYIKVLGGFVVLLIAADIMVRGAVAVALKFGIPPLVIGMTVVAIGTSAPELVVGLQAGLAGAAGMALGNVVGSNIANVFLILGCAAMVAPIVNKEGALHRDVYVLVGGTAIFIALCLMGTIQWWGGLILIAGLATFLFSSYYRETHDGGPDAELHSKEVEEIGKIPESMLVAWALLVGGIIGIIIGSEFLVDGAVDIARAFGVSEEVIGLTMIALGTSLPELAASVVAAFRGHADVALGNVVGSNLFNILGIAGVVAVVVPLPVAAQFVAFDLWVMLVATLLIAPMLLWKWQLNRGVAAIFLIAYVAYIAAQAYGVDQLLASV